MAEIEPGRRQEVLGGGAAVAAGPEHPAPPVVVGDGMDAARPADAADPPLEPLDPEMAYTHNAVVYKSVLFADGRALSDEELDKLFTQDPPLDISHIYGGMELYYDENLAGVKNTVSWLGKKVLPSAIAGVDHSAEYNRVRRALERNRPGEYVIFEHMRDVDREFKGYVRGSEPTWDNVSKDREYKEKLGLVNTFLIANQDHLSESALYQFYHWYLTKDTQLHGDDRIGHERLIYLAEHLTPDHLFSCLQIEDTEGDNMLALYGSNGFEGWHEPLLEHLSEEQLLSLLEHRSGTRFGLFYSTVYTRSDNLRLARLVDRLTDEGVDRLVNIRNDRGESMLCDLASAEIGTEVEFLSKALSRVSAHVLKDLCLGYDNLLLLLFAHNRGYLYIEQIRTVLNKIGPEAIGDFLRDKSTADRNYLRYALQMGDDEITRLLFDAVPEKYVVKFASLYRGRHESWVRMALRAGKEDLVYGQMRRLPFSGALEFVRGAYGDLDEPERVALETELIKIFDASLGRIGLPGGIRLEDLSDRALSHLSEATRMHIQSKALSQLQEDYPREHEAKMTVEAFDSDDVDTLARIQMLNKLEGREDFVAIAKSRTPDVMRVCEGVNVGIGKSQLRDFPDVLHLLNHIANSRVSHFYLFSDQERLRLAAAMTLPISVDFHEGGAPLLVTKYFINSDITNDQLRRLCVVVGDKSLAAISVFTETDGRGNPKPNIFQSPGGMERVEWLEAQLGARQTFLRIVARQSVEEQLSESAKDSARGLGFVRDYEAIPITALADIEDVDVDLSAVTDAFFNRRAVYDAIPEAMDDEAGVVAGTQAAGPIPRDELIAVAQREIRKYAVSAQRLLGGEELRDGDLPWGMSTWQIVRQLREDPANRGVAEAELLKRAVAKQRLYLVRSFKYLKYIMRELDKRAEGNPEGAAMQVLDLVTALRHCEGGRTPVLESLYLRLRESGVMENSRDPKQALLFKLNKFRMEAVETVVAQAMTASGFLHNAGGESATVLRYVKQQLRERLGLQGLNLSGEMGETGADDYIPKRLIDANLDYLEYEISRLCSESKFAENLAREARRDKDFHKNMYDYGVSNFSDRFMVDYWPEPEEGEPEEEWVADLMGAPPYLVDERGNILNPTVTDPFQQVLTPSAFVLMMHDMHVMEVA